MKRIVPSTTLFPPSRIELTRDAIKWREKDLRKCRYGDIEASLWLMDELHSIRALLNFNIAISVFCFLFTVQKRAGCK